MGLMGGLALPTLVLAPAAGRRCSVHSEAGSRLGECREQAAHLSVSLGWGARLSPGDRKDVMRAPAQQHQCACAWGCGGGEGGPGPALRAGHDVVGEALSLCGPPSLACAAHCRAAEGGTTGPSRATGFVSQGNSFCLLKGILKFPHTCCW